MRWRLRPAAFLTRDQKDWLTRGGSLTARLRALGHVEVRIQRETAGLAGRDEAALLNIAPRTRVWIREVELCVEGVACVIGRSVTPLAASHGVWQAIRTLGKRPLAELLYADRSVTRSPLISGVLQRGTPLYQCVRYALGTAADNSCAAPSAPLVARCSVFMRTGAPLLVNECFLPIHWLKVARSREDRYRLASSVASGAPIKK
jgi:chorismate--pyruvate lyase